MILSTLVLLPVLTTIVAKKGLIPPFVTFTFKPSDCIDAYIPTIKFMCLGLPLIEALYPDSTIASVALEPAAILPT